jgi:hypothetical protein
MWPNNPQHNNRSHLPLTQPKRGHPPHSPVRPPPPDPESTAGRRHPRGRATRWLPPAALRPQAAAPAPCWCLLGAWASARLPPAPCAGTRPRQTRRGGLSRLPPFPHPRGRRPDPSIRHPVAEARQLADQLHCQSPHW